MGFLTSMRLGLGMIKKEYLPMTVPNRQDVISSYVGRPAMRCREQSDKGFTLLEMLVVVAVIGVLVAIAIPVFTQQKEKAANETDAYNAKADRPPARVLLHDEPRQGGTSACHRA
ncbi:MAG: prepilin-type N-terminal cleavage/methylation domain-containing protein [Atopobiaceae bacterium]|nr:prepilin-type N-terminal cleavage/methylation domain-containing protein [Atopobiaceae bacterium]